MSRLTGQLPVASVFISLGVHQALLPQYANNPQSWFFPTDAFIKTEKKAVLKLPSIPSVRCIGKARE